MSYFSALAGFCFLLQQNDLEANIQALVAEDEASIDTFTNGLKPNATSTGGANTSLALL